MFEVFGPKVAKPNPAHNLNKTDQKICRFFVAELPTNECNCTSRCSNREIVLTGLDWGTLSRE